MCIRDRDYNNMGRTGLSVAFSFPSTFGPLLQDNFSSEENLRELCHQMCIRDRLLVIYFTVFYSC